MRSTRLMGAGFALFVLAGSALATGNFTISASPSTGIQVLENTDLPNGKTRIRLKAVGASVTTSLSVIGQNNSAKIELLEIQVETAAEVLLNVNGTLANNGVESADQIAVQDEGAAGVVVLNFARFQEIGGITLHGITDLRVAGNVTSGITLVRNPNRPFPFHEPSLTQAIINGNVLGNILVDEGTIGLLSVGGAIGTATNPVTVRTKDSGVIDTLLCGSFHGTLTSSPLGLGPNVAIFNNTNPAGSVSGNITINELVNSGPPKPEPGFFVSGALDGNVAINYADNPVNISGRVLGGRTVAINAVNDDAVIVNRLDANARVIVGTLIEDATSVEIGSATTLGLGGQVVIQDLLARDPKFVINNVIVTPNEYTTNSLFVGGGAIGLHPFPLYRQDAFPPQMTETSAPMIRNVAFTDPSSSQVRLRFYGPVALPSGASAIETIRVVRDSDNTDVTAEWNAVLTAFPFSPGRNQIELTYKTGQFGHPAAGVYRVTNIAAPAELQSDAGPGSSLIAVPDFTYMFTVTDNSTGCGSTQLDFNADEVVDQEDLGNFITAYFTEPEPLAGPGGFAVSCFGLAAPYHNGFQADFNQDCTIDQEDLNGYIGLFILECL